MVYIMSKHKRKLYKFDSLLNLELRYHISLSEWKIDSLEKNGYVYTNDKEYLIMNDTQNNNFDNLENWARYKFECNTVYSIDDIDKLRSRYLKLYKEKCPFMSTLPKYPSLNEAKFDEVASIFD